MSDSKGTPTPVMTQEHSTISQAPSAGSSREHRDSPDKIRQKVVSSFFAAIFVGEEQ